MMSKMQKTWAWIFGAMFVVPEVLFFTTPNMMQALGGKSFIQLSSWLVNYDNFFSHPNYLLTVIGIEWLGLAGLIVMNFRISKKMPITISLTVLLLWLAAAFLYVYGFKDINFF